MNDRDFEIYLKQKKFLRYQEYCELNLMSPPTEDQMCWKCKVPRSQLTFLGGTEPYYLPCWDCVSTRKSERGEITRSIIWNIKEHLDLILGDRYFQLFIIDPVYFNSTLPHDYSEFKATLSELELPNRNDIWFLDFKEGYPTIISRSNLDGLRIVDLSKKYEITSTPELITINDYSIILPETVPYDVRHHSRYSILNMGSNRKTKRLRMSKKDSDCIKFYSTKGERCKKIFRILQGDVEVDPENLDYQDQIILKLVLLRNKNYIRLVYDILYELFGQIREFSDGVFLRNTITLDPSQNVDVSLSWFGTDYDNTLNISIF